MDCNSYNVLFPHKWQAKSHTIIFFMAITIQSSESVGINVEFANAQQAFNYLCSAHPEQHPLVIQRKLIKLLLESPITVVL